MVSEDKLRRYAQIKQLQKELAEEEKELKPEIVNAFVEEDVEMYPTEFGNFIRGSRKSYTYPEELIQREESLKKEKKDAERMGTATYEENYYVIYKE